MSSRIRTFSFRSVATASVISLVAIAGSGCANGGEGAFSGAALGAAGGAIIGSVFGSAGAGAAIGAVSGAVAGGVIGDQNQRRQYEARASRPVVIENNHYYYDRPSPDGPYSSRDRYLRRRGYPD